MELSAHLAQNARLAASVVTFGALLMWSVVAYFSCMNLLAGSSCSHWSFGTHLESPAAIWSHLELSGPIWSHLESSGAIWMYLELSGAIWSYLEPSGAIWSFVEPPRPSSAMWSHLEPSGAISSYLDSSEGFQGGCRHMLSFSLIRFHPIQLNSI